ncbi:MAG: LuxR C-terminal-related transcriptional regulator [Pseudomonadota bacterium]
MSEPAESSGGTTEFILKTTAARAPRNPLVRARLLLNEAQLAGCPVLAVQASAGFGKTALLAQWRREALGSGAAVAWLSTDEGDDPARLVRALVMAVRGGCARPGFGRVLFDGATPSASHIDAITAWLAEVASSALDLVLVVDDAERLPAASRQLLNYLLHNTPSNLRVIVAARGGLDELVDDLLAYGQCVSVGAELLRFSHAETRQLVEARLGQQVDADNIARLHELTEGWPLGLQLALAALERAGDTRGVLAGLQRGTGDVHARLLGELVAGLDSADQDFLDCVSATDNLHPELCAAMTADAEAPARLARLMRDTPLFIGAEGSNWCRLHTLARDSLRARFAAFPPARRSEVLARAAEWLAAHGIKEEAARHAHAAGLDTLAYNLAEQCLLDAVRQGQLGALERWRDILPEAELARRPRLRLAAAWSMALSEHHRQAESQVAAILATAGDEPLLRYECALIVCAAAVYADEVDRFVALFQPWAEQPPPTTDPWLLQAHANRLAARALLQGDPALARRVQQRAQHPATARDHGYVMRWGELVVGQSYLWEGQVRLAEEVLRPALSSAETELGRRHPLSAMIAALLAAAVYTADRIDEAASLLANRLDVLERSGTPDSLMVAYRTAARIASAQGMEHRALDLLEALQAIGTARALPRLAVVALSEQVRLHAARFRAETCGALLERIDQLVADATPAAGPLMQQSLSFTRNLARAYGAMASQDWEGALVQLELAAPGASALRLGRVAVEILSLRALALDQLGRPGLPLLREAMTLAHAYQLARTVGDAHPLLADWCRRLADEGQAAHELARAVAPRPQRAPIQGAPRVLPSMVLTPKEREVLELLARNLSNKEIGVAMSVGEETIKWHLKNLFGKLDAASRKHAVRRAQILGLLEAG